MIRKRIRSSVGQVGLALREPEAFALRWHREGAPYDPLVFAALALTAIAGTTVYGLTIGILEGKTRMLLCGLSCTAAAGIAWSVSLPALYILNSLTGSQLRCSTTFLAALVTTSWGGLAMIASVPIAWFFTVAIPIPAFVLVVHLAVFAGVGVAMVDVFARTIAALEPRRGKAPAWWLLLVGQIGSELFYFFSLFNFAFLGDVFAKVSTW